MNLQLFCSVLVIPILAEANVMYGAGYVYPIWSTWCHFPFG